MNEESLLVVSGHVRFGVTNIFGIFDHQALVLGNLETPNSSHQLSAVKRIGLKTVSSNPSKSDPPHTKIKP